MGESFKTLWDLLEKSARSFSHRPLFGTKIGGAWRWITYDEFQKDVDRFKSALAGLGVGRGDRVAIVAPNSVEWAIAAYATFGRSAAFVPMYESQAAEEWEFILKDSGAKVVIGGARAVYDKLESLKPRVETLERVLGVSLPDTDPSSFRSHLVRGGGSPASGIVPTEEDVACVIYTSGTTGLPKGVVLTHGNICSNVNAVEELFPFEPDERSLAFLPWAHAFGQTCELHTLLGMGTSMAINDDVNRLLENLAEVRPTVLYAVPRIFNRIYDGVQKQMADAPAPVRSLFERGVRAAVKKSRGEKLGLVERGILETADRAVFTRVRARFGGRLKWVISGSAALGPEVAEFIDALGIQVYEGYGLTETSPIATTNSIGHRKIGSVGRAIPGVRIEIDRTVTEDPKIGEIIVHGPNVMREYFGRPEETAQALTPDHGLRTGDLGYLDADGYLYITGRIKEQYKLENGKYVAPAPLEEQLKLSPYIANVMLYGANKAYNVALVSLDKAAVEKWAASQGLSVVDPVRDDHVQSLIHRELEARSATFKAFERPKRFSIVPEDFTLENGMLTPTLKLKRKKVLERYGKDLERLY
ncbi:MAG TPA: long-chain fatty acid--CoA ligase [Polyangiaceae bacterium]|nr:long-chain fatty acid--CoA ligase [Polyangiaceae bacterium]